MNTKVQALKSYLVARLKEQGTWQGLIILFGSSAVLARPDAMLQVTAVAALAAGAVKALFPDA